MIQKLVSRSIRAFQDTSKYRKQLQDEIKRRVKEKQGKAPVSQLLKDPDFMKNYEDLIDIYDMHSRGMLTICPTPLGNLLDISIRQFLTLKKSDMIACENIQVTGQLISLLDQKNIIQAQKMQAQAEQEELKQSLQEDESIFGLDFTSVEQFLTHTVNYIKESRKKKGRGVLISCQDQNEQIKTPKIVQLMRQGLSCALVVDAGTPTIANSGQFLVQEAIKAGIVIDSLPGPLAATVALSMSGMPCHTFYFQGYLPQNNKEKLETMENMRKKKQTCVIYESGKSLKMSLTVLETVYGSHHQIFVVSDLTKVNEQQFRGSIRDLALKIPENLKGEVVIIIAPFKDEKQEDFAEIIRISDILKQNVETNDIRLIKIVSEITGKSRNKCLKVLTSK